MKYACTLLLLFAWGYCQAGPPEDSTAIKVPFISKFFKDRNYLLVPELGRKPETGFLTGIYYLQLLKFSQKADTGTRTSNIESYLDYTERKQILAQIKNTLIFKNEEYILTGENFYNKFPDYFWGIGGNTPNMQESVSYELYSITQRLLKHVGYRYFAGIQYQYVKVGDVQPQPGGLLDIGNVPGASGSMSSGMGFVFTYDSRDNILNAYKGFYINISNIFNAKMFGAEYHFTNWTLDTRKFLSLGKKRVLALQGYVNYNTGNVPFRQMASIGGDMIMRGYYYGRFRDKVLIASQAEYRFNVWRFIGLTFFASAAEVAPTPGAFNLDNIHYTLGACIRFMINKAERLNVGVDSGFGKQTNGLYFNSGEAF